MLEAALNHYLKNLLPLALQEDIADGDITSEACIAEEKTGLAIIHSKEKAVVAGLPFAEATFKHESKGKIQNIELLKKDGDTVEQGEAVMTISGSLRHLVTMERTALNILQRLSGIASITATFIQAMAGTKTKLLDTRKTLPAYRLLEKYAVACGGGTNHRMGLFDLYMIKDNHIKAAGSIREAIKLARIHNQHKRLIEVECKTLQEVDEALLHAADIIMLDNMDNGSTQKAIERIHRKAKIEISGNVTRGRVPTLARLAPDYISSGALTHSALAKDFSMNLQETHVTA